MKKTLIIFAGIFFFSCNSDNTTRDTARETDTRNTETTDESVEIGSGEEISPQLDMQDDTAAFEVDTISTPQQSNQQ
ncbi:hypothetical protein K3G39_03570 [Pontibacter sp. HSC-14F20]|uniref:hypothetical protein n=1 Tax=Pontibacter sp. HSC-14F20 TaxID=2864136 RepID=UPI001C72F962|nr:hypothetical protein [Pontibacter sp. HSC-14F20]MBX0332307.1 hypothetical protein [Pontibacter sp. HSC-14F20]